MTSLHYRLFFRQYTFFILVVVAGAILAPIVLKDTAVVKLEMTASEDGNFKLFWIPVDKGVTEKRSAVFPLTKGRQIYSFSIPDPGKDGMVRLDIDPIKRKKKLIMTPVIIHHLSIQRKYYSKETYIQRDSIRYSHPKKNSPIQLLDGEGVRINFLQKDGGIIFDVRGSFCWYFVLIPLLFLILLHTVFRSSQIKGSRKTIKGVIKATTRKPPLNTEEIIQALQKQGYMLQIDSIREQQHESFIHFHLQIENLGNFSKFLTELRCRYDIFDYSLACNRSGEINRR